MQEWYPQGNRLNRPEHGSLCVFLTRKRSRIRNHQAEISLNYYKHFGFEFCKSLV